VTELRFAAPPAPLALLRDLVELYAIGQDAPLPFEYLVSRAYADALEDGKGEQVALDRAALAFGEQQAREGMVKPDAYVQAFFRRFEDLLAAPAGGGFASVAERVFHPFFSLRSTR
jgi:exonuclease V gamma subunit